jgi:hypothetical protein
VGITQSLVVIRDSDTNYGLSSLDDRWRTLLVGWYGVVGSVDERMDEDRKGLLMAG